MMADKFEISNLVAEIAALTDEKEISNIVERVASEVRGYLFHEWGKGSKRNVKLIGKLLEDSKWLLSKMNFMPANPPWPEKDLVVARDILEIGVRYSVETADMTGFDRYMAQLNCYYFDLGNYIAKESSSMYELLGMNLLKLLEENRIGEFHTQLELFIQKDGLEALNNEFIKKVTTIEQNLAEGRFNQIFKEKVMSSSGYQFFINRLLDTIRDEIGDCIQKAYEHLKVKDAAVALNLEESAVKEYAKKRGWTFKPEDDLFVFNPSENAYPPIQTKDLIEQMLQYAKEMERIV